MIRIYKLSIFLIFLMIFVAIASCFTVNGEEGNTGEGSAPQIWNVPEEERVYNNTLTSSNLVFPKMGDNITVFAEELGGKIGNKTITANQTFLGYEEGWMLDVGREKRVTHYRFWYTDDGFLEILIDKHGNFLTMKGWFPIQTNVSTAKFIEESRSTLEKMGFMFPAKVDVSTIFTNSYNSKGLELRNIVTYINSSYKEKNVVSSRIEIRSRLNEYGNANISGSFEIGVWYNITVEPYLTEYGARYYAEKTLGNHPIINTTVTGFVVINRTLYYHVQVLVDNGLYDCPDEYNFFVDVQNADVLWGRVSRPIGHPNEEEEDEPFYFTTEFFIIAAVMGAAVVVGGGFVKKKRKKRRWPLSPPLMEPT